MENVFAPIIERYGIYGLLLIAVVMLGYFIWGDRKNNWGSKIDCLCDKVDIMGKKINMVKDVMDNRIGTVESMVENAYKIHKDVVQSNVKTHYCDTLLSGKSGQLSKTIKYYINKIGADHMFLGSFHNGTTDIRGLHYCKFDILMDVFKDPLHIHENDTDYQPLYREENIVSYGDFPYTLAKVDSMVINVDDDKNTLMELSDTLYRRCKSRNIKQLGIVCLKDKDELIVGFVGAVSFNDTPISEDVMRDCAKDLEVNF